MLTEKVSNILSKEVGEVIASPIFCIELLRVYSILYQQGAQVGWCEKCIRNYYLELQKTGLKMAKIHDDAKKRTLIFSNDRKGISFWRGYGHIQWELVTDEQAILLLEQKIFSESMFQKLPSGYKIDEKSINIVADTEIKTEKTRKNGKVTKQRS